MSELERKVCLACQHVVNYQVFDLTCLMWRLPALLTDQILLAESLFALILSCTALLIVSPSFTDPLADSIINYGLQFLRARSDRLHTLNFDLHPTKMEVKRNYLTSSIFTELMPKFSAKPSVFDFILTTTPLFSQLEAPAPSIAVAPIPMPE